MLGLGLNLPKNVILGTPTQGGAENFFSDFFSEFFDGGVEFVALTADLSLNGSTDLTISAVVDEAIALTLDGSTAATISSVVDESIALTLDGSTGLTIVANLPSSGDARCVFSCNRTNDNAYEYDETDFSTIQTVSTPSTDPRGIGGTLNNVWHVDAASNLTYELDPTDLTSVRSAAESTGMSGAGGVGGDDDVMWRLWLGDISELDVTDFSEIRSGTPPGLAGYYGGGGDDVVIWGGNNSSGAIYKIDPSDFSETTNYTEISVTRGAGGGEDSLWNTDDGTTDNMYELDVTDGSILQTQAFNSGATQTWDIGGK